jgi:hypothetical protein
MKKATLYLIYLFCFCQSFIFFLSCSIARESFSNTLRWNMDVNSPILNVDTLSQFKDALPQWKVKQMIWPSNEDVNQSAIVPDQKVKDTCVNWLKQFVIDEYLPEDLSKNLIAMREWGLIREKKEQKRLCDVFILRLKKNSTAIQIQESPYNVVISFADDKALKNKAKDHKQFVLDTAKSILKDQMNPDSNSDIHTFEIESNGIKISRILWLTKSVGTTDRDGKKAANLISAGKNGAVDIQAETDGSFIRFEITKYGGGPASYFDPFEERFAPTGVQPNPNSKKRDK